MVKLYLFSKKIHRFLALIISIMALIMMVTGLNMKYGWFFLNPLFARKLHNAFSIYFAVVLSIMALAGLVMFIFPYWQRWQNKKQK
jgi:uncharacterized iron-regulated membrane protein